MKKQIILPVLLILGLTFGAIESKAQQSSTPSKPSQTTEMGAPTNNLMASAVESKTTVAEKSSVNAKTQKPVQKSKKDWEDRSLAGKILIVTGAAIFIVLAVMYGTVSVG